jgi:CO/xanthine dehydrogenase Mo-binding subunit
LHGNSEIDYALLRHAGAEVGQGAHTAFMIMTARALNLPIEKIKLVMSDTRSSKNSGSVSASRMTFMAGNAIIGAAKQAVDNWNKEERPAIGEFKYVPPATTPLDPETGKSTPNFAYGYVAESVTSTIDTETGEIVVDDVCVVDDVGFAVNPGAVEGQIEGAISQALGYAITENFVQKNGQVLSDKFSTYLIPTVLDMPKVVRSLIVEHHDPLGPFGVRGMGEMPFIPFAPALTHSVFTSTGIWFNKIPLTPYRVLSRINDK